MRRATTVFLSVVVIVAFAVFAYTLVNALWYAPETTGPVPANVVQAPVATTSLPSLLIIPALSINAHVQDLGVNSIGNMQAPDNFTDVGWYKYGTVPGYIGSAVIDGHVNNGLGLAGVFLHLDQLQVGDDVYVQTIGGTMLHFVVSDVEVYPYQSVPTAQVFAQYDAVRLNIVTCDGTWVHGKDTYNERLVVYTTYVGQS
ncbi:MAG TPA: class F sortase [Candidatus Paceibacterota bacterium]|jgi:LPXTG-site transpeptidase (sortase) family protein|nr:class F sortase [Candidatus Paceibacterota bacterium]